MKKIISFVLSFCLFLTTLATGFVTVFAEGNLIEGTSVSWSFNAESGELLFEGEGAIPDYNNYVTDGELTLEYPWKDVAYKSVSFGEGITAIGNYAFCYSPDLTSVVIPENITVLGEGVFYNCENLETAVLPDSVSAVPDRFFSNCSSLNSVTLGSAITEIGKEAFYTCGNLETIEFPATLVKIGEAAFAQCISLKSLVLPEGLTAIGDRAFYCCENLEEITLPSTLVTIGSTALGLCSSLKSLVIPDKVTDIPDNLCNGCSSLESVQLPAEVYSVGDGAFNVCPALKGVSIPSSITSIGTKAFGYGKRNSLVSGYTVSGYHNTVARLYAEEIGLEFVSLGYLSKGACGESVDWEYVEEENTLYVNGFGNTFGYTATDFVPHNDIPYEKIEISKDITGIREYAFFNAPAVNFTLLENVTEIGEKAIGYCYDEEGNIVLREGTSITGYDGSAAMTYAAENNITFISLGRFIVTDGKLGDEITWNYNKETKVLTVSGTGNTYDFTADALPEFHDYDIESITVSDGITVIGDYALCTSIAYTKVTLGKDIYRIGKNAVGFIKSFELDEEGNPTDKVIFYANDQLTVAGYIFTPADEYCNKYGYTFEALDSDVYPLFSFVVPYSIDHMDGMIYFYTKRADLTGIMSAFPSEKFDSVVAPGSIATGEELSLTDSNGTYDYSLVVKGDISGDGDINSSDALIALQHSVQSITLEDGCKVSAADLNRDGKINSSDALLILQISVGSVNVADLYDPGIIG